MNANKILSEIRCILSCDGSTAALRALNNAELLNEWVCEFQSSSTTYDVDKFVDLKLCPAIEAKWDERDSVYRTIKWMSDDGDNWTHEADGTPVDSPEFHTCTIKFSGGPRDGEEIG